MTGTAVNKAGDDLTHVRLEFNTAAAHVMAVYALDRDTERRAGIWAVEQKETPTAEGLAGWLDQNGGLLDRADGPALVTTYANGVGYEEWYSKGLRDRADGPAFVKTYA